MRRQVGLFGVESRQSAEKIIQSSQNGSRNRNNKSQARHMQRIIIFNPLGDIKKIL